MLVDTLVVLFLKPGHLPHLILLYLPHHLDKVEKVEKVKKVDKVEPFTSISGQGSTIYIF